MYILKATEYKCNGPMTCGLCEQILPGFMSENFGEIKVSAFWKKEKEQDIKDARAICPTGALVLEKIE